jgi:hypothetical protein
VEPSLRIAPPSIPNPTQNKWSTCRDLSKEEFYVLLFLSVFLSFCLYNIYSLLMTI